MTALLFVDSNVFIYAWEKKEPAKQLLAARWLEILWREQTGRTSIQALSECYVTLTRKVKPAVRAVDAWDYVHELFAWKPQPIDADLLVRGKEIEHRYRLSWWDSLIVGSAQQQNCAVLLTEDLQDRSVYGNVTVRNPFVLGVSEDLAEYGAKRVAGASHPRRGRPSRIKV